MFNLFISFFIISNDPALGEGFTASDQSCYTGTVGVEMKVCVCVFVVEQSSEGGLDGLHLTH